MKPKSPPEEFYRDAERAFQQWLDSACRRGLSVGSFHPDRFGFYGGYASAWVAKRAPKKPTESRVR